LNLGGLQRSVYDGTKTGGNGLIVLVGTDKVVYCAGVADAVQFVEQSSDELVQPAVLCFGGTEEDTLKVVNQHPFDVAST